MKRWIREQITNEVCKEYKVSMENKEFVVLSDEPGSPLCSYATHFHFSDIAYWAWLHHCDCHTMQPSVTHMT